MKIEKYGKKIPTCKSVRFNCNCGTTFVCNIKSDSVVINHDQRDGDWSEYTCPVCGKRTTSSSYFYEEPYQPTATDYYNK